MDFQAVVWRTGRLDRLQAGKAADAMIDVHHQIAGREAGGLGDEILRAARGAARPHQPVAKDVLLADDRRVFGLETGIDAEHSERDRGLGQRHSLRPRRHRAEIVQFVVGEHVAHALARAVAPQRDRDALAGALQAQHVPGDGFEYVGVGLGALGGEIASLPRAGVDHIGRLRHREGRQPRQRRDFQTLAPLAFGEIKPLRRQRLVRRRDAVLQRLLAGLVIVGDLRQALMRGIVRQMLQRQRRPRQIVEQRLEL